MRKRHGFRAVVKRRAAKLEGEPGLGLELDDHDHGRQVRQEKQRELQRFDGANSAHEPDVEAHLRVSHLQRPRIETAEQPMLRPPGNRVIVSSKSAWPSAVRAMRNCGVSNSSASITGASLRRINISTSTRMRLSRDKGYGSAVGAGDCETGHREFQRPWLEAQIADRYRAAECSGVA